MKKPKTKRYTLALNEVQLRRLTVYAEHHGIDRPTALARIVSQTLRDYATTEPTPRDESQLCLFDSLQFDIFNNTSKAHNPTE